MLFHRIYFLNNFISVSFIFGGYIVGNKLLLISFIFFSFLILHIPHSQCSLNEFYHFWHLITIWWIHFKMNCDLYKVCSCQIITITITSATTKHSNKVDRTFYAMDIMMWSFIWILISHVQSFKGFIVYILQFCVETVTISFVHTWWRSKKVREKKEEWTIWWAKIGAKLSKMNFEAHAKEKIETILFEGRAQLESGRKLCGVHGVCSFWFSFSSMLTICVECYTR